MNKKSSRLICTVDIDMDYCTDITEPTVKKYAERIGADFYSCKETTQSLAQTKYNLLFQARHGGYEKVLLLDADVLIRRGIPNIFDHYENALFNELPYKNKEDTWTIVNGMKRSGHTEFADENPFYNMGVILLNSEGLEKLSDLLIIANKPEQEKYNFNSILIGSDLEIESLHQRWNTPGGFMLPVDDPTLLDAYFIHVNGIKDPQKRAEKLKTVSLMFP
jgi:hypothetical protein